MGVVGCSTSEQQEQSTPVQTGEETVQTAETSVSEEELINQRVEEIMSHMTLEEKLGQMMIVSFRGWEEPVVSEDGTEGETETVNVTELNDDLRQCLTDYSFGGFLLFGENTAEADQTLRLVSDIQQSNQNGGGLPMLIGIDEEGGSVTRLSFGTSGVGNMALAATGDTNNAAIMGGIYGRELSLLGINADFAPVMDINNNPDNPVIGVRSFSDDPETVSSFGISFMEGLTDEGIIATLKHFPGHGNTDTDSHTGFPVIDSTLEELQQFELIPFQAAIDAGADMIMTAHIQYPQIEPETYTSISTEEEVYLPATMSHTILTDILRDQMGYEGVIISDALDMAAISENFAREDVLTLSINAGVNLLILPPVYNEEQLQTVKDWTELAVSLTEDGSIDIELVDDSVRRILKLKIEYGILDQSDFSVTEDQVNNAQALIGSEEDRQTAFDIACEALTLLNNENEVFPLQPQENESVLVLFADSCASRVGTGELVVQQLREQVAVPESVDIEVMTNTRENGEECITKALEADHVILVYRVYNSACLDPDTDDGFSSAVFDSIIEARHEAGNPVILVSCQLPYDAGRFPDADAILLCYGSSPMRQIPLESGAGSAYVPNLQAALLSCFGLYEPMGSSPVGL
ncbi:MAG: glycoside hydrolase family 3 protein [Clostridiales bacterium]|nr:glycoside hydrolase family 3 protein [Clostridiales bacterium]